MPRAIIKKNLQKCLKWALMCGLRFGICFRQKFSVCKKLKELIVTCFLRLGTYYRRYYIIQSFSVFNAFLELRHTKGQKVSVLLDLHKALRSVHRLGICTTGKIIHGFKHKEQKYE